MKNKILTILPCRKSEKNNPSSELKCHQSCGSWIFPFAVNGLVKKIWIKLSALRTIGQKDHFEFWALPISTLAISYLKFLFLSFLSFFFLFSSSTTCLSSSKLILSANVADGGGGSLVFQERDVRRATLRKNVNLIRKASSSGRAFVTLLFPPLS